MDDPRTRADLTDAFGKHGCAICRLIHEHTLRQIDTLNYECVMDPDVRAQVKRSAGFCRSHVSLWYEHASKLATAQIYGDVLDRAAGELQGLTYARRRTPDVVRGRNRQLALLAEERRCLICQGEEDTLRHLVKVFGRSIAEERLRTAFDGGTICFDHGRVLLENAPDAHVFDLVRARLVSITKETRGDLAEIVRKHDHRFGGEQPGKEVGAGERAIRLVTGEPGS